MIVRLSNPMSAVVWLAFLLPGAFLPGWTDRAFGALAAFLACVTLLTQPSPWEARKDSALVLKIFLLLQFLYVASALYSAGFNGSQIAPLGLGGFLELLRWSFLGAFSVYLVRHYDGHVRGAAEWAMIAALYSALLFPAFDPQAYVSVMTLCWLLFFSKLRLRFLHAATALLVVFFSGSPTSWAAAYVVFAAAFSVSVYHELVDRRLRFARRWGLALFILLAACLAAYARVNPILAAALRPASETVAREFIRRSPLFGWGPVDAAGVLGRSQYFFWTLKGGKLGAAAILAALLFAAYRLLRSASSDSTRFAGAAAFLAGVALMLTAGRFLESYRLCFVTAFFMAAMRETPR